MQRPRIDAEAAAGQRFDMLKVYAYSGCGTCRKALAFLAKHGVAHEVVPIRDRPPTERELASVLAATGGEVRRLFNTSGQDYRAMGLSTTLATMPVPEALRLLAKHGNLVKRPFVVQGDGGWVGFEEARWKTALGLD